MKIELKKRKINNITELGIGDVVCAGDSIPMTVIGLWADYEDYTSHIADNTGEVICDFDDNEGDVFEYDLSKTGSIQKILLKKWILNYQNHKKQQLL